MALATLTSKGQVTIPKAVRNSLHLHAGDKVEFVITESKEALLRPSPRRSMMYLEGYTCPVGSLFLLKKWILG